MECREHLCHVVLWCSDIAQLYSTKPELRFCAVSNHARGVLEIQSREDLWQLLQLEINLNAFCLSTIPQKQCIIYNQLTESSIKLLLLKRGTRSQCMHLRQFDIDSMSKLYCKVRWDFINFKRWIHIEIMTSIRGGNFGVDSNFKIDFST